MLGSVSQRGFSNSLNATPFKREKSLRPIGDLFSSHIAKMAPDSTRMRSCKAILFDMDGLMLDTERIYMRAYQQAGLEHGLVIADDLYLEMIGFRANASHEILRRGLGPGAPIEEIIEAARRHYYAQIERNGVPLRPGLKELLDYLHGEKLPLAVATSTHYDLARRKLEAVGLLKSFVGIVSGDQVPQGKPAPDIFLAASKLVGCPISECLVLEDSPIGVQAAHESGAYVVLIPDLKHPTREMRALADEIYPSLDAFLREFRNQREHAVGPSD